MTPRIMRAASRPTSKAECGQFLSARYVRNPVFAPEQPLGCARTRVSFSRAGAPTGPQHDADRQILYGPVGRGAKPSWKARR